MNKNQILQLLALALEKEESVLYELKEDEDLSVIDFDSLRFIQFIINIEMEYDIEIKDSDLQLENFNTIHKIFKTLSTYEQSSMVMKKVLILDCDNVLWKGISGEEEILLTEEYITFHKELIQLYQKGVLLCLCSKNDIENVKDAFETLDMLLQWEHIVCLKINYCDKVQNIKEIAEELKLSTDSFVFVDDSNYEIGLINAMLPEVTTILFDVSNPQVLIELRKLFSMNNFSELNRTKIYKEQKERAKEKYSFATVEEYNFSLRTQVTCEEATLDMAERIAELSQRTNQFNLSGRRYTTEEMTAYIQQKDKIIITLSVIDKYGDMGIVGAAVANMFETYFVIENYMISCRVFGRGFEAILLQKMREITGNKTLYGIYQKIDKNYRYENFYAENGVILYEKLC